MNAIVLDVGIVAAQLAPHLIAPDEVMVEGSGNPALAGQIVPAEDEGRRRDAQRPRGQHRADDARGPLVGANENRRGDAVEEATVLSHVLSAGGQQTVTSSEQATAPGR